MTEPIAELKHWYETSARSFLLEHEPGKVEELDIDIARLLEIDRRAQEDLAVCFLGVSGVGKSTLINALVAGSDIVLPAGGIGPLTALAMQVTYRETPGFEADYQPPQNLRQLIFGVEQTYKRQVAKSHVVSQVDLPEDFAPQGDEDDHAPEATSRFDLLCKQAQLLVTGSQHGDHSVEYLLDCLREAVGQPRAWGTIVRAEDAVRLTRLRSVLELGKRGQTYSAVENGDRRAFLEDLRVHAAGFLAPLIRELRVYWDSPLLKPGLTTVDLPGVGVSGDVYKEATKKWIVEKARAVVLVVSKSGITEPDADLLRTSGFLTRLLFSVDDPKADPAVLAVAVTQLDASAEARYAQDTSKKKRQHLADVSAETVTLLKHQVRQELTRAWAGGNENLTEGQQQVIDRLIARLQVYPVSAFQFRRLLASDDDDAPFINEVSQSGVPQMVAGLRDAASVWREKAAHDRAEAVEAFRERVMATLQMIAARWQEDGRSSDEAARLRADLEEFITPLRRDFDVRKGAFREFLRTGVPDKIDALVREAASSGRDDIDSYLRRLKDAHWSTLRAAVKRDGAYDGARYINLPDDFVQRFVEPIAEVWGSRLLQDIRKRSRDFTDDCVGQVEEVVEWCRSQGTRVQPALLEAQVASIKADTKQIQVVGKDVLGELRDQVKANLLEVVRQPIRKRCQEFVRKGDHIGPHVKLRILDLFSELAKECTGAATEPARNLLIEKFRVVEQELKKVTARFENPLDAAADAIVSSHEDRVRRSDAQRRKGVLAALETVEREAPAWTQSVAQVAQ